MPPSACTFRPPLSHSESHAGEANPGHRVQNPARYKILHATTVPQRHVLRLSLWRSDSMQGSELRGLGFAPRMALAVWQRLAEMCRLMVVVTMTGLCINRGLEATLKGMPHVAGDLCYLLHIKESPGMARS